MSRRPPLRTASHRLAAVLLTVLALLTAAPATGAAASPSQPDEIRYRVRSRGPVRTGVAEIAAVVDDTLNDPLGWSGGTRWRRARRGGDLTIWVAAPSAMTSFAAACSPDFSCRVGDDVVLNDRRWRRGSAAFPGTLVQYRRYLVNHEVGHWLGLDHAGCRRPGAPAPVMMQQSKGTDGCRPSAWPRTAELRAAGLPEPPAREREEASRHGRRNRHRPRPPATASGLAQVR